MVNNGPSRGCLICRRRKIKCDETVPECRRCLLRGYKCPGVRENRDVTFRHRVVRPKGLGSGKNSATTTTIERLDEYQGFGDATAMIITTPSKIYSDTNSSPSSTYVSGKSTPDSTPDSSPHRHKRRLAHISPRIVNMPSAPSSMYDLACATFIPSLVQDKRSLAIINPWTSLIAESAGRTQRSAYYDNALSACSLRRLADTPSFHSFKRHAASKYGQALQLLNSALREGSVISDECLVSIMLINIYGWNEDDGQVMQNYNANMDGLLQTLIFRGVLQTQDPVSCRIFCAIRERISMNYSCLCKPFPFPRDSPNHAWFFATPTYQSATPWDEIQKIALDVPYIRHRMLMLSQRRDAKMAEDLEDLIGDAKKVHDSFIAWYRNLPDEWQRPQVVVMPNSTDGFPTGVGQKHTIETAAYLYPNASIAMVIAWFHCYDMLTLQVILACLTIREQLLASDPSAQQAFNDHPFTSSHTRTSPPTSSASVHTGHPEGTSETSSTSSTVSFASLPNINTLLHHAVDEICRISLIYHVQGDQVYELDRSVQTFDLIFTCYMIEPIVLCLSVASISAAQKVWIHEKICNVAGEYSKVYHASALAVLGIDQRGYQELVEQSKNQKPQYGREDVVMAG